MFQTLSRLPYRCLNQLNKLKSKIFLKKQKSTLNSFDANLLEAFDRISKETGTTSIDAILKNADLLDLLNKLKPRSIVELGSGRTSICFASYAKKTGASYVSYEQNESWRDIMNSITADLYQIQPVKFVPIKEVNLGGRYDLDVPQNIEFLYVDGPYVAKKDNFQTFTGKPAYVDVVDAIKSGNFPKVVVVDGRTDTVDIINAVCKEKYTFYGSFTWAVERMKFFHGISLNRHSVFIRSQS